MPSPKPAPTLEGPSGTSRRGLSVIPFLAFTAWAGVLPLCGQEALAVAEARNQSRGDLRPTLSDPPGFIGFGQIDIQSKASHAFVGTLNSAGKQGPDLKAGTDYRLAFGGAAFSRYLKVSEGGTDGGFAWFRIKQTPSGELRITRTGFTSAQVRFDVAKGRGPGAGYTLTFRNATTEEKAKPVLQSILLDNRTGNKLWFQIRGVPGETNLQPLEDIQLVPANPRTASTRGIPNNDSGELRPGQDGVRRIAKPVVPKAPHYRYHLVIADSSMDGIRAQPARQERFLVEFGPDMPFTVKRAPFIDASTNKPSTLLDFPKTTFSIDDADPENVVIRAEPK